MEEFTDALEKVRAISADIMALEAESLNAIRCGRKGDDEKEEFEEEEEGGGEEEGAGDHEEAENYCAGGMRRGDRRNNTASTATPRRLQTRGTGSSISYAPPLYTLMNYPECPREPEPAASSRPRLGRKKDRTSLREQMEASCMGIQDCECDPEDEMQSPLIA